MSHRWARLTTTLGECHKSHTPAPKALMLTCGDDCIEADELASVLEPGAWRFHCTPGNVVPPHGAGFPAEEQVIEKAVGDVVQAIVVCGHSPCDVLRRLLEPAGVADDFLLRDWLDGAEAARQVVLADSSLSWAEACRSIVEENLRVQLAHLRTHPTVRASRLPVFGWLFDAANRRLLFEGQTGFDRTVALDPTQNRWLCRDHIRFCVRPSSRPCLSALRRYLA
jgi:carbonic anhydrase